MFYKYPKTTSEQVGRKDFMNNGMDAFALQQIMNLCFNQISPVVTAGVTGETVSSYFFVVPTKCQILDVNFIRNVVQTGSGNTPVVKLFAGADEIGTSGAIALSGTAGSKHALTVDPTKNVRQAGDVLRVDIINPTATITVAIAGILQVAWNSIV